MTSQSKIQSARLVNPDYIELPQETHRRLTSKMGIFLMQTAEPIGKYNVRFTHEQIYRAARALMIVWENTPLTKKS